MTAHAMELAVPEAIREVVQDAIVAATGRDATLRRVSPIGGGCMSPAAKLETAGGDEVFLKWNDAAPASMFDAEADGLRALRAAAAPCGIRVPEVLGLGGSGSGAPAWLLMEFIRAGVSTEAFSRARALLHGDLWNGNVFADPNGRPVLVDPAIYRGHREVDLAMSELFGGFPTGWLQHYHDAAPIALGYEEVRRPLYQLYYLLVHVNLFGAGYVGSTLAAAEEVIAEVS
jgi:fructosamine-3-kinase